jgi:hypothetical protein
MSISAGNIQRDNPASAKNWMITRFSIKRPEVAGSDQQLGSGSFDADAELLFLSNEHFA